MTMSNREAQERRRAKIGKFATPPIEEIEPKEVKKPDLTKGRSKKDEAV